VITAQEQTRKADHLTGARPRRPRPRPLIRFPAPSLLIPYLLFAAAPAAQLPLQGPDYLYCERDAGESDEPGRAEPW